MRIKICGITNLEDALLAEKLGATFLGFIFYKKSPRDLSLEMAQSIIQQLTTAKPIGLFVEQNHDEILSIAHALNLWGVQIYQDYNFLNPSFKVIRALRIKTKADIIDSHQADFLLLDTYHANQLGGSGQSFDWTVLPKNLNTIFLAGGIHAANIREALSYQPYALDINSGVEAYPGKKDSAKLAEIFDLARS